MRFLPLSLMMFTLAGQCLAANDPGGPGTLIAKGQCSRLIMGADDYSTRCDAQAASVTLEDGTVMFVFSVEGTPIWFSGNGHLVAPAFGGVMKLPVDSVAVGVNADLGAFPAEGSCVFGDPYAAAAIIWCVAITEGGPFLVTFKTDGSPPVRSDR